MPNIKSKKEIILIVVAIILLAVVLVGYFVFNNSDKENYQNKSISEADNGHLNNKPSLNGGKEISSSKIIFSNENGVLYKKDIYSQDSVKIAELPHGKGRKFADKRGYYILWIDFAGGLAEDYGIKEVRFYYNLVNGRYKEIELLKNPDSSFFNFHLSPSGTLLAYEKEYKNGSEIKRSLVVLDLLSEKEKIIVEDFSSNFYIHKWSNDSKRIFVIDQKSRGENSHSWFVNDVILIVDIESGQIEDWAIYSDVCEKASAISVIDGSDNLILFRCDLSPNFDMISYNLYNRDTGLKEELIKGNPFDEISGSPDLSPDASKLIYYSIPDKSRILYDRELKEKKFLDLGIKVVQPVAFNPDSSKFICHFESDTPSSQGALGIFMYDFEKEKSFVIEESGNFVSWIEEGNIDDEEMSEHEKWIQLMEQGREVREAAKERILKNADQETLVELEYGFYKDKNRIYDVFSSLSEAEQLKIDPETFEVGGRCFIKDKNYVYVRPFCGQDGLFEKIEEADPESFDWVGHYSFGRPVFKDKNNVYYGYEKVEGADPESFELLTLSFPYGDFNCYAKDKNNAFYYDEIIPDADLETFEVVKCGLLERIAKDKYRTYEHMVLEE